MSGRDDGQRRRKNDDTSSPTPAKRSRVDPTQEQQSAPVATSIPTSVTAPVVASVTPSQGASGRIPLDRYNVTPARNQVEIDPPEIYPPRRHSNNIVNRIQLVEDSSLPALGSPTNGGRIYFAEDLQAPRLGVWSVHSIGGAIPSFRLNPIRAAVSYWNLLTEYGNLLREYRDNYLLPSLWNVIDSDDESDSDDENSEIEYSEYEINSDYENNSDDDNDSDDDTNSDDQNCEEENSDDENNTEYENDSDDETDSEDENQPETDTGIETYTEREDDSDSDTDTYIYPDRYFYPDTDMDPDSSDTDTDGETNFDPNILRLGINLDTHRNPNTNTGNDDGIFYCLRISF